MRNLVRLLIVTVAVLFALYSNAQTVVDFKLYNSLDVYAKEGNLSRSQKNNLKKYYAPAPYMKLITEGINPNINKILLTLDNGEKIFIQNLSFEQNDLEYVLPYDYRDELAEHYVIMAELVRTRWDYLTEVDEVIYRCKLEDKDQFIKYFEVND